jgi:adenosine deaminase
MSGVTLTEEYEHAQHDLGFTWDDLVRVARMGFESAYVPDEVKATLLAEFDRDVAGL